MAFGIPAALLAWATGSTGSCRPDLGIRLFGQLEAAKVEIRIHHLQPSRAAPSTSTLIYGSIRMSAERPIVRANLTCVRLEIDGLVTQRTYVDAFVHFIPEIHRARQDGTVRVPVYWHLSGRVPSSIDAQELKLHLGRSPARPQSPCIFHPGDPVPGLSSPDQERRSAAGSA